MGEIDTKSIESVQAALSLFGEKGDQKKYRNRASSSDAQSHERDEPHALQKELANYKVQLEAKDSAHMQVLLKLRQYEERASELTTMLVKSELERDQLMKECRDAGNRAGELEFKVKEMADQLLETAKVREQLSHVLNELKATQAELLDRETELAAAREKELMALAKAEMAETAAARERKKSEDLSEAILVLKAAAVEAEKERSLILSEEDEQLGNTKRQAQLIEELENQLRAKSVFIESLHTELNEANKLLSLSEKAASDAMANVETLRAELQDKEWNIAMETELNLFKAELNDANETISRLNGDVEALINELEEAKSEMGEIEKRESDAQVEIALLKSELHKARARTAAAEAAELRADSVKSGLYLAVQQLAVEAGEAKKESLRLRIGAGMMADDAQVDDNFSFDVEPSSEESESLLPEAETANPPTEANQEVEALKKELEAAMAKIGEFRTRAEQATSRAESAEKAKLELEDQLRRWREHKQRRKAALAALREESAPRKFNPPAAYVSTHPPLGKVLNMKF